MARVSDHLSQSTCLEMLHKKTDEHVNPRAEVHHLFGKLSTAETLLTEVQRKVTACPRKDFILTLYVSFVTISQAYPIYEGRLISNAHSEISRKRDHVFKQMKVGSRVQYFTYILTYLFFDIVALSFNTFFQT